MTEPENKPKPTYSIVIFTLIWIAAAAGFLGLLTLSVMAFWALRDPEVMLVWVATPIQLLAVIKSIGVFQNVDQIRTDGAAFALAILILVGATLLNTAILISIILIGCS